MVFTSAKLMLNCNFVYTGWQKYSSIFTRKTVKITVLFRRHQFCVLVCIPNITKRFNSCLKNLASTYPQTALLMLLYSTLAFGIPSSSHTNMVTEQDAIWQYSLLITECMQFQINDLWQVFLKLPDPKISVSVINPKISLYY